MSDDEWEDTTCPTCGANPIRSIRCGSCDNGLVDLYDEDPVFYADGQVEVCEECHGTGLLRWCPDCGADVLLQGDDAVRCTGCGDMIKPPYGSTVEMPDGVKLFLCVECSKDNDHD